MAETQKPKLVEVTPVLAAIAAEAPPTWPKGSERDAHIPENHEVTPLLAAIARGAPVEGTETPITPSSRLFPAPGAGLGKPETV